MRISDRIYGEFEIPNPLLVEVIESKPFQRLKKISQDGAAHFIQPVRNVTRFEHSIGVWYLSHKYKRTLEEQIASLLHDLSHTAFSHVVDFVVQNEKNDFHDKFTKEVILDSEIPSILKKNGVSVEKVLEKQNFDLLENELPDISVDRWDYFMRDGYTMGFLPQTLVQTFLDNMYSEKNCFYFTDARLASLFAILFATFSRLIWLDPTSHGAFFLLAEAIKIGLIKQHITQEDLFTDDEVLLEKLQSSHNSDIDRLLSRLEPGREFEYANEQNAEFYGPNKPRYVNPFVKTENCLQRVSKLVPSLDYFFKEFSTNYKNLGVIRQK